MKPPDDAASLPDLTTLSLGGLTLLNFFMIPVWSKSFLYNLDCADLAGDYFMRVDLREACTGDNFNARRILSAVGVLVFNFGSIGFAWFVIRLARKKTTASEDEEGNIQQDF